MPRKKLDTRYYQVAEVNPNAQIGDTPDCLYIDMDRDDAWELLHRLLDYVRYDKPDELFNITLSCKLVPCGLWGSKLSETENNEDQKSPRS